MTINIRKTRILIRRLATYLVFVVLCGLFIRILWQLISSAHADSSSSRPVGFLSKSNSKTSEVDDSPRQKLRAAQIHGRFESTPDPTFHLNGPSKAAARILDKSQHTPDSTSNHYVQPKATVQDNTTRNVVFGLAFSVAADNFGIFVSSLKVCEKLVFCMPFAS